jgi:tripartite-type tricarboxylate transporter receptor subunit TctC
VLPEVPSVTELGLDDRDYVGWYGLLAPKGTPRPMLNKINAEIARILDSAEMKARIRSMGAEPNLGSPEQFRKFIADETEKWGGIARAAKIVVE